MRKSLCAMLLAAFVACATGVAQEAPSRSHPELYGLWLHPGDAGRNQAEVAAFMDKAQDAHINTIVLLVKSEIWLFYASKLFPEDVDSEYRNFDLLRAVTIEAHKRGMKVHAWLVDFVEGRDGYAFKHHPEWAAINPDGQTTASEMLGPHRPYSDVWMCPARRPGYTDQYLLPVIREIVTNYDVDGIHHDYVRYPGDVNPDGYCFCDYCLEHIEMYDPINKMNVALEQWAARQGDGGAERAEVLRLAQTTLSQLPTGPRKSEFEQALQSLPQTVHSEAERQAVLSLQHINERLVGDPPPGFFPPERLLEAIRAARRNGADGIVFFAGGSIQHTHLWEAVKEGFEQ